MVAATLRSWGVRADPSAIVLVTSELMTNAVRHGEGLVEMEVHLDDDRVRIEVHDADAATPAFDCCGLHMVEALADDWGIERGPRTVVWAETSRTA